MEFEKTLQSLQDIVKLLESGTLSLDESIKKFEEGVKLSKSCQEFLSNAEKRVEQLTRES